VSTELDVAMAVASGALPSPTQFHNAFYVNLRITGTGVAWRASINEFVYRDPKTWLSNEMRRRVLGLPVVIEHPAGDLMTSRYFGERVVGVIVHAMVRGSGLWGVARIIDATACQMIAAGLFDTSPAAVFDDSPGAYVDVDDDAKLLVEASPALLDHLALIYVAGGNKGVWQRDKGPGVEVSTPTLD
jgi:colicin import membrane protein